MRNNVIQTEDPGFVREISSHALLSTDTGALRRSRAAREHALENLVLRTEVTGLRTICDTLQQRLDSLTELLNKTVRSLNPQQS